METKVTAFAATQSTNFGKPQQPAAKPAKGEAKPLLPTPDPAMDLRLVIEEDQGSGSFVYKTVNRLTGEVISSLPRAEVLKLRGEAGYAAGSVIKTEA